MPERDLREVRRRLEAQVDLADFDRIVERGRGIRRRRQVAVVAGAALAAAAVALAIGLPGNPRVSGPVTPPPHHDRKAERVISSRQAQVDTDRSALDSAGAVLSVVTVPSRSFGGGSGGCQDARPSAFRWIGPDGTTRDWSDATAARKVAAVPGGFVVSAIRPGCPAGELGRGGYVVDDLGRRAPVHWDTSGTRGVPGPAVVRICAPDPLDPRCRVSVAGHQGWLVRTQPPAPPSGAHLVAGSGPGLLWASSADEHTLFWSRDGGLTWDRRTTRLTDPVGTTITVAGRHAAFATTTKLEATADGGRTWRVHDLAGALSHIRLADVDWTLTSAGDLIGVTTLVAAGDVVFRSTDAGWTTFRRVHLRTSYGQVFPQVVGRCVYVPDVNGWWVSTDAGRTWRAVSPLPPRGR